MTGFEVYLIGASLAYLIGVWNLTYGRYDKECNFDESECMVAILFASIFSWATVIYQIGYLIDERRKDA